MKLEGKILFFIAMNAISSSTEFSVQPPLKLSYWNLIYEKFNPIAFKIFHLPVHWYSIAYISALLSTLYLAIFFAKKYSTFFDFGVKKTVSKNVEFFILWAEIGVILGARIGYVLIYDPNWLGYLTHPWQIFNPFSSNGEFIGIRGMSYHGGIAGFLITTFIFSKIYKKPFLMLLDLIALALPLAYVLGRIGNFLNQELIGKSIPKNSPWESLGILVNHTLVYPSQLIEAFLEGICVFLIVLLVKRRTKRYGILIATYTLSYSIARFVSEIFREPDEQLGVYFGLSMGQILSILMFVLGIFILYYAKNAPIPNYKNQRRG